MIIKMDRNKVVLSCVSNEWYKKGSCYDYSCMLDMCDWDVEQTEESIKKIARNIFEHSTGFDMDLSINEHISNIAFVLLNNCCYFFLK